jgi:integrase
MRSALRTPSLRRHKPSSLGVVTLNGKDHYLGPWPATSKNPPKPVRLAYDQLIAEWLAAGRRLQPVTTEQPQSISVNELLLAFWQHAQQHYRHEDGTPTNELVNLRYSFRLLKELYGMLPAAELSPLKLKAVRQRMIDAGLCRTLINQRIGHVLRLYRWAVAEEIIAETVQRALAAVPGLQQGRTEAREAEAVQPVAVEVVEAALPRMPRPVAAMARLQLLTGMRAGEVMAMRGIDLNTSGPVWVYRPRHHKNRHLGLDRIIHLGPKAQEIVRPFLRPNIETYLFSPRAYVEELHARRAAQRKTRRTPSGTKGPRKANLKRKPAERYDRGSYRQAIVRACEAAGVPAWSPLQLRHTAATLLRAKYGVEAAKVILGHTRVETSQIYAERDLHRAQEIMREVG